MLYVWKKFCNLYTCITFFSSLHSIYCTYLYVIIYMYFYLLLTLGLSTGPV